MVDRYLPTKLPLVAWYHSCATYLLTYFVDFLQLWSRKNANYGQRRHLQRDKHWKLLTWENYADKQTVKLRVLIINRSWSSVWPVGGNPLVDDQGTLAQFRLLSPCLVVGDDDNGDDGNGDDDNDDQDKNYLHLPKLLQCFDRIHCKY